MHRFLSVWLANWPVQRVVVKQPKLRGKPVILYGRDARQRQFVAACSSKARSLGVRDDMPLADAAVLVEEARPFTQPHDATADREELIALANWCNQFTPVVSVEWPDGLCLQIDGVTHMHGDEAALAGHVASEFRFKGYEPRLAIAGTSSAAWAVAHFASASFTVVPVSERQLLLELPVAALRLSEAALQKLDRLGVHRIQQLVELPRKSLPSRIGQETLDRLDYLLGNQVEGTLKHIPLPTFEQQWPLDQATDHLETIEQAIQVLLGRLADQLRRHGKGATRLAIFLDCPGDRQVQIETGLCRPSADAQRFFPLVQMQLEKAKLSAAVECVTVVAEETELLGQLQHSLLSTDRNGNQQELAKLVERLSSHLGAERVVRAVPIDDLQPEKAFYYQPCTQRSEQTGRAAGSNLVYTPSPAAGAFSSNRPLRMFFPPLPVDVISVTPDGPPVRFHYEGEHQVTQSWGPDRLETAWWRGASVKRDYYRVDTESGSRFWLFRRFDDARWFLHGCFD